MARTWRIRHKLMLGMALVIAIMALLLGGSIKGLTTYKSTMKSLEAKFNELEEVDRLRALVKGLAEQGVHKERDQAAEIAAKVQPAREALVTYQAKLNDTAQRRQDPNYGFKEKNQVVVLDKSFAKLEKALADATRPGVSRQTIDLLREEGPVRKAIDELITITSDLTDALYREVDDSIIKSGRSRREFNVALGFVISTSILAVCIMIGLLRFFYSSVFHPIRQLGLGVARLGKADFDHQIDVRSGDEIEDLAKAFNDMTSKLRDMYGDLAQQVNERSRQLVRSERLAGVGFLAAGVAHEINNPLASIAFCSEALEQRLAELFQQVRGDKQDQEIISKYLKMIQDEAFRCKEITQKLLAFSRGGDRKREPADLGELIQGVLDMVQHLPNAKDKELVYQPGPPLTAWINAQEVKQVFLNLVVNAVESMDEGGRLTITQGVKNGQAILTFQDNGCGMSSEILENIFEPFFTRSRTGKGTGLGLSISHRIISQHGGEIEADSAGPGLGSTFTIRIPLEAPAEQGDSTVGSEGLDPETEFSKLSSARKAA